MFSGSNFQSVIYLSGSLALYRCKRKTYFCEASPCRISEEHKQGCYSVPICSFPLHYVRTFRTLRLCACPLTIFLCKRIIRFQSQNADLLFVLSYHTTRLVAYDSTAAASDNILQLFFICPSFLKM